MKEIKITSSEIKQAIDDLVNENELLQDKIYKQEDEIERLNNNIKEAIKLLDIYFSNGINVQEPKDKIKKVLKRS